MMTPTFSHLSDATLKWFLKTINHGNLILDVSFQQIYKQQQQQQQQQVNNRKLKIIQVKKERKARKARGLTTFLLIHKDGAKG